MRFVVERAWLRLAAAAILTLAPVFAFARLVGAEGPIGLLLAWEALAIGLVFLAGRPAFSPPLRIAFRVAAGLVALAGLGTVLLQVNVARRSLAEAWLDLARAGNAFGFFSFFAAEIYGAFCLGAALLLLRGRYALWALAAGAVNGLCAGIILGRPLYLAASFVFAAALFFCLGSKPPLRRLRQIAVPAVSALAWALWLTASGDASRGVRLMPALDFSGFVSQAAPGFPLLRDVPGYGFSIGSAKIPSRVYLSSRVAFRIQGEPLSVVYLPEKRFRSWTGGTWVPIDEGGAAIPWGRFPRDEVRRSGAVRLELVDDFSATAPMLPSTDLVGISEDYAGDVEASEHGGIRFLPGARRGVVIDLVPDETQEKSALDDPRPWIEPPPEPRLAELGRELRRRAAAEPTDTDRRFLELLLERFSSGYSYSLSTPRAPRGTSGIEHFLFESKEGFCLYYSSAFALLARAGGLPARLSEGYRVVLDESGEADITGNNAHAWPEIWIDGRWRIFEPTPPYAQENPFAWLDERDGSARRQLEALFGPARMPPAAAAAAPSSRAGGAAAAILAALAAAALLLHRWLTIVFGGADRRLRRKAGRLVRKYRKRGILPPEVSGWEAWKLSVADTVPGIEGSTAVGLADRMIQLAYARRVID